MKFVLKKALPMLNRSLSSQNQDTFPVWINQELASRTSVFEKLEEHGVDVKGTTVTDVYKIRENQFKQLHFWGLNGTIGTKLSLIHSLWERDPTNDLRVINFCISVPEEQYVLNGFDRSLIRRSTKNYLPDNIRLNQHSRGIQGADGIHRMKKSWSSFIEELYLLSEDPTMTNYINIDVFRDSLEKIKNNPKPELIYEFEFKILMRSLILYRFLKNV